MPPLPGQSSREDLDIMLAFCSALCHSVYHYEAARPDHGGDAALQH